MGNLDGGRSSSSGSPLRGDGKQKVGEGEGETDQVASSLSLPSNSDSEQQQEEEPLVVSTSESTSPSRNKRTPFNAKMKHCGGCDHQERKAVVPCWADNDDDEEESTTTITSLSTTRSNVCFYCTRCWQLYEENKQQKNDQEAGAVDSRRDFFKPPRLLYGDGREYGPAKRQRGGCWSWAGNWFYLPRAAPSRAGVPEKAFNLVSYIGREAKYEDMYVPLRPRVATVNSRDGYLLAMLLSAFYNPTASNNNSRPHRIPVSLGQKMAFKLMWIMSEPAEDLVEYMERKYPNGKPSFSRSFKSKYHKNSGDVVTLSENAIPSELRQDRDGANFIHHFGGSGSVSSGVRKGKSGGFLQNQSYDDGRTCLDPAATEEHDLHETIVYTPLDSTVACRKAFLEDLPSHLYDLDAFGNMHQHAAFLGSQGHSFHLFNFENHEAPSCAEEMRRRLQGKVPFAMSAKIGYSENLALENMMSAVENNQKDYVKAMLPLFAKVGLLQSYNLYSWKSDLIELLKKAIYSHRTDAEMFKLLARKLYPRIRSCYLINDEDGKQVSDFTWLDALTRSKNTSDQVRDYLLLCDEDDDHRSVFTVDFEQKILAALEMIRDTKYFRDDCYHQLGMSIRKNMVEVAIYCIENLLPISSSSTTATNSTSTIGADCSGPLISYKNPDEDPRKPGPIVSYGGVPCSQEEMRRNGGNFYIHWTEVLTQCFKAPTTGGALKILRVLLHRCAKVVELRNILRPELLTQASIDPQSVFSLSRAADELQYRKHDLPQFQKDCEKLLQLFFEFKSAVERYGKGTAATRRRIADCYQKELQIYEKFLADQKAKLEPIHRAERQEMLLEQTNHREVLESEWLQELEELYQTEKQERSEVAFIIRQRNEDRLWFKNDDLCSSTTSSASPNNWKSLHDSSYYDDGSALTVWARQRCSDGTVKRTMVPPAPTPADNLTTTGTATTVPGAAAPAAAAGAHHHPSFENTPRPPVGGSILRTLDDAFPEITMKETLKSLDKIDRKAIGDLLAQFPSVSSSSSSECGKDSLNELHKIFKRFGL